MSAIILDGHLKSALAIVRSLGVKGVPIYCGAERNTAMASHSKYINERFVYPSPLTDQAGFIEAIKQWAIKLGDKPVVYACSDGTYLTLFKYREELKEILTFLWPSDSAVDIAFDKGATYSKAVSLGIRTIPTILPTDVSELPRLTSSLSYPAVVKTRHSVTWKNGQGVAGTAYFVQSAEELSRLFTNLQTATDEAPLIQPFIKGEEYGVELLVDKGKVLAETIHHRIRSLSPTGGASVVKETMEEGELTVALRESADKLAQSLSWSGPLMVEFKQNNDTKELLLMEINGRWWGSLPLAVVAGVDFPYLHYLLARGEMSTSERLYARPLVATRHFLGDVLNLFRVLSANDPMRSYLYPTRKKALRDFFRVTPGTKSDVWSWRDPLPSLMEYIDIIKKRL